MHIRSFIPDLIEIDIIVDRLAKEDEEFKFGAGAEEGEVNEIILGFEGWKIGPEG
jgi:hypothetical protein